MREIKFRGKRLDNGEWVKGHLIQNNQKDSLILNGFVGCREEYIVIEYWKPVNPYTVGQFTGLKDKNGVEIYEGDIVRDYFNAFGYISYNDENTCYEVHFRGRREIVLGLEYYSREIEVIGNIYDNKDF